MSSLETVLPGFADYVACEDNLFDPHTVHGVFAACCQFVRERTLPSAAWRALAGLLNEIVGGLDAAVDNAACTCFLENLAAHEHPLHELLRGEALAYWQRWCDGA